ncbi:MAG: hypothetical protein FJX67_09825 [Alphaproteobacteria bacterium]|nr:hypothetical protein [Alphaproteobacteria bacterium]
MRSLALTLAFALAVPMSVATTAAARAETPCTERTDVVKHLDRKYAEAPVAIGLTNNGGVIEVFSTKTGGSWTILLTMPNGTACVVAAGQSWEQVPHAKRDPST